MREQEQHGISRNIVLCAGWRSCLPWSVPLVVPFVLVSSPLLFTLHAAFGDVNILSIAASVDQLSLCRAVLKRATLDEIFDFTKLK